MSEPVAANPLTVFMDRLVPPRNMVITDLGGNEYRVSASVSARRHVEIVREIQAVLAEPALQRMLGQVGASMDMNTLDLASLGVHVLGLTGTPEVVDHLAGAFTAAYPEVVLLAQRAAHSALHALAPGAGAPFDPKAQGDAADLFAVEEIIAGLVPLFVGLARRSVQALGAFGAV